MFGHIDLLFTRVIMTVKHLLVCIISRITGYQLVDINYRIYQLVDINYLSLNYQVLPGCCYGGDYVL